MTANIVIRGGFRQIFYFPFREETLKKAGTLVKANHVRLAEENFSQGGTWIFGKVTRSMSVPADPYAVRFQMDSGTRKYVRGVDCARMELPSSITSIQSVRMDVLVQISSKCRRLLPRKSRLCIPKDAKLWSCFLKEMSRILLIKFSSI